MSPAARADSTPNHSRMENTMESNKEKSAGPNLRPRNGPLVLDEDRDRQKTEVELTAATAQELREYAAWVEMSSSLTTADATSTTVEFALRDLFGATAYGESGDTRSEVNPCRRRRRRHGTVAAPARPPRGRPPRLLPPYRPPARVSRGRRRNS